MPRTWRIGMVAAGATFTLLLFWGLGQMQARKEAEMQLGNRYQQAFFDALGHVENVEVLLSKGIASSAPEQIARVFSDLTREAGAAQANLTQLPLQQGTLLRTSRFLTQVSDFAYSMARNAAAGTPPSNDSMELTERMQKEAALLSAALHQIQQESSKGAMPWEELRKRSNVRLREDSKHIEDTGFNRLESHFQKIPVIQYDGPFSDHLLQREPHGLVGEKVSESRAEEIALEFLNLHRKDGGGRDDGVDVRTIRRVEGGDIPAFGISITREADGRPKIVMDVSEKGGHVVWMIDPRRVSSAKITVEEAVERARAFLEKRKMGDMVPTFVSEADNRVVIPFIPEENGILIYPDLVKVTVALDDGSIVGYEALGYLMSHRKRTIDEPEITAEEARSQVAGGLTIQGEPRLALIPLPTLDEVLTWEISATMGDEVFLVYINAVNGQEEQILRLVHTAEGDLAI